MKKKQNNWFAEDKSLDLYAEKAWKRLPEFGAVPHEIRAVDDIREKVKEARKSLAELEKAEGFLIDKLWQKLIRHWTPKEIKEAQFPYWTP